jgi:hypothetical protein
MRKFAGEGWAILKLWWLVVPGGVLGVVSIIEAVKGEPGRSVWFWAFLAVVVLLVATCWRLRTVAKERDDAVLRGNTREAIATRLDQLLHEGALLRDEIPAGVSAAEWKVLRRRKEVELTHLALRIESELRVDAPGFLTYWKESPDDLPPKDQLRTAANAREIIDFSSKQLRRIAKGLRDGHDTP